MLKGFKEFLFRGDNVDIVVAFVIGTAFVALVTAFSANVINPIVASAGGEQSFGFGFEIREGNPATFVDVGTFITAVISFVITVAVVYFFVVIPMTRMLSRHASRREELGVPVDENLVLLREIRDALAAQHGTTGSSSSPPAG